MGVECYCSVQRSAPSTYLALAPTNGQCLFPGPWPGKSAAKDSECSCITEKDTGVLAMTMVTGRQCAARQTCQEGLYGTTDEPKSAGFTCQAMAPWCLLCVLQRVKGPKSEGEKADSLPICKERSHPNWVVSMSSQSSWNI